MDKRRSLARHHLKQRCGTMRAQYSANHVCRLARPCTQAGPGHYNRVRHGCLPPMQQCGRGGTARAGRGLDHVGGPADDAQGAAHRDGRRRGAAQEVHQAVADDACGAGALSTHPNLTLKLLHAWCVRGMQKVHWHKGGAVYCGQDPRALLHAMHPAQASRLAAIRGRAHTAPGAAMPQ